MDFDVMVVGAGPSGSLAARDLARAGLRVGLFEASAREDLGKPIIVEVEKTIFARVGVACPQEDEIPYHPRRYRVFSARRRPVFTIERGFPAVALYLDRFARKLLDEAEAAGAQFFERHRAVRAIVRNGAVCGAEFRAGRRSAEARARLVIDATGFGAALVRDLDPALGIVFRNDPRDVVVAENALHEAAPDRAADAVRAGLHGDEEIWTTVGPFGNYSTEFSFLSIARRRTYILIGLKADYPGPAADVLVRAFRERQGYYGRKLHGGGGKIRIDHALDRLVADGFLVVGEAASMVNPLLGSGVASGLWAAHLAAKTAAGALGTGEATTRALWPYAAAYQRGRGATLAAIDAARLVTETLTADQTIALLESGISGPADMIAVGLPRMLSFSPRSVIGRAVGLIRRPDLAGPLARVAGLGGAIWLHHRAYPRSYDPPALAAWSRRSRRLFAAIRR